MAENASDWSSATWTCKGWRCTGDVQGAPVRPRLCLSPAALSLPTAHPFPHPQTSSPVNSAPTSSFGYYHFKSLSPRFHPSAHLLPPPPLCLPPSVSALPGVSNLLPDFFILPPPSPSPRSPSPTRSLTAYRVVAFSHLGETLKINEGCAGIWEGRGGCDWETDEGGKGAGYAASFSSVSRSLTQPSHELLLHPLLPWDDADANIN